MLQPLVRNLLIHLVISPLLLLAGDAVLAQTEAVADRIAGRPCENQAIEYCIQHNLKTINAGAQGEHKIQRGFTPVLTHSWHYLAEPSFSEAIADFLAHEKKEIQLYLQQTTEQLPFKNTLLEKK